MKSTESALLNYAYKVLVIDDDEEYHKVLQQSEIFDENFEVTYALDAQDAEEKLANHSFGLILLDLFLNKKTVPDGLELIPKITKLNPSAAICAISKSTSDKEYIEAINKGVDYFLRKTKLDDQRWRQVFLDIIEINYESTLENKLKEKPRILLVDDEEDFYENIQYSFLNEFNFDFAFSIDQAKGMLEDQTYDLIILDIHFEGAGSEDGLDFLEKEFKDKRPFQQVIIASKKEEEDFPFKAGKLGASSFLNKKKFNRSKWLQTIKSSINLQKQPSIFISHSSQDKDPLIFRLRDDLLDRQTQPFIDYDKFEFGGSLTEQIALGIYSCNLFLLVLSQNSTELVKPSGEEARILSRPWIYEEHEFALNLERCGHVQKIIPILLDEGVMNTQIITKDNGAGPVKDLTIFPRFFPVNDESEEEAYQRGLGELLEALKAYRK